MLALVVAPGRASMPDDEFLRGFGAADGERLGLDLLWDAVRRHDATDVELALIVSFCFGLLPGHVEPLVHLAFAEWHERHEDVASALGWLGLSAGVDALVHLALWVPDYLEFDDARALAVKAIWGLGATSSEVATQALMRLAMDPESIVAHAAVHQLQK